MDGENEIDFSIDLDDLSVLKEDTSPATPPPPPPTVRKTVSFTKRSGAKQELKLEPRLEPKLEPRLEPRLYIDLREESEIQAMRVVSNRADVEILCIPSRNIFANVAWIRSRLNDVSFIYLLCRTGSRAGQVKNVYFMEDDAIQSVEGGIYREIDDFKLVIGEGSYGMAQYTQLMFAGILAIVFFLLYARFSPTDVSVVVLLLISMILYQVFTRSCILSRFIPLVKIRV